MLMPFLVYDETPRVKITRMAMAKHTWCLIDRFKSIIKVIGIIHLFVLQHLASN